jgi:TatD DNase family protein
MHLIDSHCHLNELNEIQKAIQKANECNVKTIISNSVDLNSMKQNLNLSSKFSEIKTALGLHPSNILLMNEKKINEEIEFIKKNSSKCIALGEIGLDFKHAKTNEEKEKQKKYFIELIELGIKLNKPLIIHSRYSGKECLKILEEMNAKKVLMHWFTNSKKEIIKASELNYFTSIGANILFSKEVQENIKLIPLNLMLFETDSPISFNGIPAKPYWIKEIAEKTSEIHKLTLQKITKITYNNAEKLFFLQNK